jgi:DNA (cytosine-5)-methyltransferase 1
VALRLSATYPETDLGNPRDPLDDLLYIILSGQTSEHHYQSTFRALKTAYPKWRGLAQASLSAIEKVITNGGLAKQKAGYLKTLLERIEADHGKPSLGSIRALPTLDAEKYLAGLPGVGIKTARCVLMYTLHREVFPADVNCLRVMERLGWLDWRGRRAELLADAAQDLVPAQLRRGLHIGFIQHGRAVCTSSKPDCQNCCLQDICSSGGKPRSPGPAVVDLCCGAGGFSWGFMQAGCEVRLGVDIDRHALATFAANLPGAAALNLDITGKTAGNEVLAALGVERPKIVIAGPPCQGFSRAGSRDPEDPRNEVLNAAVRLAVKLNPEVIVVENVLYLGGPSSLPHLQRAMGVVRSAGYCFQHTVVDSSTFGVPQSRQRIVLIASRTGTRNRLLRTLQALAQRQSVQGMSVAGAFAGLPPAGDARAYNHEPMIHKQEVIEKIRAIKPGEGPFSYRKLDPTKLAPTVVCGHRALPCHYVFPRTITPREAARLQGFPDDFKLLGSKYLQGAQVANAVPPRLALGIALAVLDLLEVPALDPVRSLLDQLLRRMHFRPT